MYTFDGANKLIILDNGTTSFDAIDLYSRWKDWMLLTDNSKWAPALRTVAGDPTTGTQIISPYFFLINGWKIRPQEATHLLTVNGNLFSDDGSDPFVSTVGNFKVSINLNTTSNSITNNVAVDSVLDLIRKLLQNRSEINPTTAVLTIFDDDDTSTLQQYQLSDENDNASFSRVLKKNPL